MGCWFRQHPTNGLLLDQLIAQQNPLNGFHLLIGDVEPLGSSTVGDQLQLKLAIITVLNREGSNVDQFVGNVLGVDRGHFVFLMWCVMSQL